jgi:hypothetical protein
VQPAAHEGSPFSTGASSDARVCAWCLQHVVLRLCLQHDIEHCDVFNCANAAREGPAATAVSSRTATNCSAKRTKLRLNTIARPSFYRRVRAPNGSQFVTLRDGHEFAFSWTSIRSRANIGLSRGEAWMKRNDYIVVSWPGPLHFGTFGRAKVLSVILGLVPPLLLVTGSLMD